MSDSSYVKDYINKLVYSQEFYDKVSPELTGVYRELLIKLALLSDIDFVIPPSYRLAIILRRNRERDIDRPIRQLKILGLWPFHQESPQDDKRLPIDTLRVEAAKKAKIELKGKRLTRKDIEKYL
jgi:hypothetical protein